MNEILQKKIYQWQAMLAYPDLYARLEQEFGDLPGSFASAHNEILWCLKSLDSVTGILNNYGKAAQEDFVGSLLDWAIKRGNQWKTLTFRMSLCK